MTRLRSEYVGINGTKRLTGLNECGVDENVKHIICDCQMYKIKKGKIPR